MRCFAFLRAINVGGRRPKSPELVAAVAGSGIGNPAAFLASGNLAFDAVDDLDAGADPAAIEARIEARLVAALGYPVETFLRTTAEAQAIVDDLPLVGDGYKHQVILFKTPPPDAVHELYAAHGGSDDRFVWRSRELIWTHPGNMSDSPLFVSMPKLAVPLNTVRTANTLERLLVKFA